MRDLTGNDLRQRERGKGLIVLASALGMLALMVDTLHNGDPPRPELSRALLVAGAPFLIAGLAVLLRGVSGWSDYIGAIVEALILGVLFPGVLITAPLSFLPTVPLLVVVALLIPIWFWINEAIARGAGPVP